ncbi:serine/threonine-protein kinase OSR1-like [Pyrus ussuriensis x Pyrus communis]|uniref:Serine/threonine-protein kinase OSR1-like n=1 Tax=Pyrus ussuriensis x Pyrus communis TaxID=2448454 RepID=A0A5N5HAW5_9ROSA|nr:serine/threonine-protein kinase OSR1-like [Pyrus ussuriensis x Pyrus communis]
MQQLNTGLVIVFVVIYNLKKEKPSIGRKYLLIAPKQGESRTGRVRALRRKHKGTNPHGVSSLLADSSKQGAKAGGVLIVDDVLLQ